MVEKSEGRYSFIIYAIVVLFSMIFAFKMPVELEGKQHAIIETDIANADDTADKETFCQRFKTDWKILVKAFKSPVFYRF